MYARKYDTLSTLCNVMGAQAFYMNILAATKLVSISWGLNLAYCIQ